MKIKTLILIVLFSTGISTTCLAQQATNQEPTLEQTLDWICKFLKLNVYSIDCGVMTNGGLQPNAYNITYDLDKKSIVLDRYDLVELEKHTEIFLKYCTSIECKGEYIYIKSDSDSLLKHTEKGKYSNNDTKWAGYFSIFLPAEYNTKLEKALKHAAKLCGATFFNKDLF